MAKYRPAIIDDDFVDLGLSIMWAKCNLGANVPEEYGNYYAGGEIAPKKEYTKDNSMTYGKRMSCLPGNQQYDAATATLGPGVRLPLLEEIKELREKCTIEWTTRNSINGCIVTGPNGNSIFLPAAGDREGMSFEDGGVYGYYWSSMPYDDLHAYYLGVGNSYLGVSCWYRYYEHSIRPVKEIKV